SIGELVVVGLSCTAGRSGTHLSADTGSARTGSIQRIVAGQLLASSPRAHFVSAPRRRVAIRSQAPPPGPPALDPPARGWRASARRDTPDGGSRLRHRWLRSDRGTRLRATP